MALQLVRLGRAKQPLYNEFSNSLHFENNARYIAENLFKKIKETGDLMAMLDRVVRDHFGGPVDFFDANGKPLGPTKLRQVQRFWEDEKVQTEAFKGQATDYFVDGSCFGWHVSVNNILTAKQKELLTKLKAVGGDVSQYAKERASMPRKISYIAASTTTIKHDQSGIKYYIQEAGGKRVRWNPDQIVHVKNMDLNGEVRGYSPLKSMTQEIVMMYMLKENIIAKLANGGSPDYIISMKNANGVSRARFERLRTALESFSHLRKSHGNMPIDADVETHPLGTDLKDMEYRQLAMFVMSEFALALGLPTSRIPFMMTGEGGSANKGELSGNSEDSYQDLINTRRKDFEDGWNRVFRPAGFTFRFRRTNRQDDVRETTAMMNRTTNLLSIQDSLFKAKKRLTLDAHLAMLSGTKMNILAEDVEDIPAADLMPGEGPGAMAGMGSANQPSKMDSRGRVTGDMAASKKRSATNKGVTA